MTSNSLNDSSHRIAVNFVNVYNLALYSNLGDVTSKLQL